MPVELECAPFAPIVELLNKPGYCGGRRITSYFGGRIDPITGQPGRHGGVDIQLPLLEPYYAVWSGPYHAGWDPGGGGNWLTIYHRSAPARFGYGHLSNFALPLGYGWVEAGTLVGYCGTTGKSTGPHLHAAFDDEDPDTAYDDPYDPLMEVFRAGRFPGHITPEAPMSDAQLDAIRGDLAKIHNLLAPFGYRDEVEWDMKDQTIEGVALAVKPGITEAGWASRPYLVKTVDSDHVYELRRSTTGWYLVHVPNETAKAVLVKAGCNPHTVEFSGDEAVWLRSLDGLHPKDR